MVQKIRKRVSWKERMATGENTAERIFFWWISSLFFELSDNCQVLQSLLAREECGWIASPICTRQVKWQGKRIMDRSWEIGAISGRNRACTIWGTKENLRGDLDMLETPTPIVLRHYTHAGFLLWVPSLF